MKKLFVLFTLFMLGLNASAQLAPVGTKWVYETLEGDITEAHYGREEKTIIKDTLIDGTIYSQIEESFYTKENSKIYYYKKEIENE
jgi:transcription-repair coupling factor (superfamily II helicase)